MFLYPIFKKNNTFFFVLLIASLFLFYSCGTSSKKLKIVIEEKSGFSRNLDYVKIALPGYSENFISLEEIGSDTLIYAEKLKELTPNKEGATYIFPITIDAFEKKSFYVSVSNKKSVLSSPLAISGEGIALAIENEHFTANFEVTREKEADGLYPGQLATLYVKKKDILLERDENNIHWSPNFQKEGLEYKTIGHLDNENTQITENNDYVFSLEKSGNVKEYEEIDLKGKYTFYANLPYFTYSSTILINKNVTLSLLRNDEITANKLFTHLIFPNASGMVDSIPLYGTSQLDSLTNSPLSDTLPWIGFINKEQEYGFISIRLSYDNTNLTGKISPLYKPQTKISFGANEGRYWNRRLINDHGTLVPKGSRYKEVNAYLVLEDLEDLTTQIQYYKNSLQNPLDVSYVWE